MFMEIAIGAIGIGVVLMVGYLVIAQVRTALVGNGDPTIQVWNGTAYVSQSINATAGMSATQTTVFAGFGLISVGIIVLAAFGLVSIFK